MLLIGATNTNTVDKLRTGPTFCVSKYNDHQMRAEADCSLHKL